MRRPPQRFALNSPWPKPSSSPRPLGLGFHAKGVRPRSMQQGQPPRRGPPPYLRRWRRVMVRIANYFEMLMSGHYVLMILSGRPNLRDHLVRAFFPGAEGPTPYQHFTTVVQHDTARRLQNPGNE